MSDFTSDFWGIYVAVLTILSIGACFAFLTALSTQTVKKDAQGKIVTTGHVWDENLEEYSNPLPRWWMWMFYITLAFAVVYLVLYPGAGRFTGMLGWTSKNQFETERDKVKAEVAPLYAKFAALDVKALAADPQARAIGERLFLNNCAQCHGSDAGGARGFPNLRDKDWLFGGEPDQIKQTITEGRQGAMPKLGGTLSEQDVMNAANYVLSISGQLHNAERAEKGKATFQTICAACHGPEGKGNQQIGAPNLTDGTWLYGGSEKTIIETITNGRNGKMPSHKEILEPEKIHLLTAFVWGLSNKGGAASAPAAATAPAAAAPAAPAAPATPPAPAPAPAKAP